MTYVEDSHRVTEEAPMIDPYKQMWLAVIVRAFRDLEMSGTHCDAVERWALIRGEDEDFRRVCDLAGLNPDDVRKHMVSIIKERNEFKHAPPIDDVLLSGKRFNVDSLGVRSYQVMHRIDELRKEGHTFTRLAEGLFVHRTKKPKPKAEIYNTKEIDKTILSGEPFVVPPGHNYLRGRIGTLRQKGFDIPALGKNKFLCTNPPEKGISQDNQ